ncbi:MAG: GGDEF domain-containing protein [Rhizobiaceae bacterium]|nr:GGDEF domain-containing protein [Rhizobiaceae bacterium]MBL4695426.1 GGDEF domain-containing protein [Rhizobiaceae bacterium]
MNVPDTSKTASKSAFDSKVVTNKDYEVTVKFANTALELANTHSIPPVPKAYEVWYTYASGTDLKVKTEIDKLINGESSFGPYDIELIHSEFLSSLTKGNNSGGETSVKLEKQMVGILDLMQSHIKSGEDYSGTLNQTMGELSDAENPNQVKKIIEFLIAENTKMRDRTSDLATNLKRSKKQIQTMQTKLKKAQENEMRDSLTNISNRRWFEQSLVKEIAVAREKKTPMCLALIDIDHFKRVNDTYGHVIGDQVLKFFGSLLKKSVKGGDIVARYGGEEFAAILPNTEVANAKVLIENIRTQLESAKLSLSRSRQSIGTVTASFGVTQLRDNDIPETFVKRADKRLYEAKNRGRNRTVGDNDR